MKLLILAILAVVFIHQANATIKEDIQKKAMEMYKAKSSNETPKLFNNMLMKIDKKGGKMIVVRKGRVLAVRVKAISEKYDNETVVNDVKLKDLTCTVTKNKDDDNKYSIPAVALSLDCDFPNGAKGLLEYYMFKAAGNFSSEDGNEYDIREGSVKINLKISNWPNEAKHLDVVFGMKCGLGALLKGKIPQKMKNNKKARRLASAAKRRAPESFSVCPEANGFFAANFKDGSIDKDMPEGYPKDGEDTNESEAEVTLRFTGSTITYDPVMEVGDDIMEENADVNHAMSFVPNFLLVIAAFVVGQIKFF